MVDSKGGGNLGRMARVLVVAAVSVAALCLTACNTVKGVGRDVQEAGEAGERAIEGN